MSKLNPGIPPVPTVRCGHCGGSVIAPFELAPQCPHCLMTLNMRPPDFVCNCCAADGHRGDPLTCAACARQAVGDKK